MRSVITVGAILMMSAMPTFAQQARHTMTMKPMTDQEFVMSAARSDMAEIELGKLAQVKAANSEVKAFGKRMADDHQKALDSLKTLAAKENITLPTGLDPKTVALRDRLDKLSGNAFDRAYMQ